MLRGWANIERKDYNKVPQTNQTPYKIYSTTYIFLSSQINL